MDTEEGRDPEFRSKRGHCDQLRPAWTASGLERRGRIQSCAKQHNSVLSFARRIIYAVSRPRLSTTFDRVRLQHFDVELALSVGRILRGNGRQLFSSSRHRPLPGKNCRRELVIHCKTYFPTVSRTDLHLQPFENT